MNSTFLLINARRLGQQQPLISNTPLAYPPSLKSQSGTIPLHDLISHIVTEEVNEFTKNQREQCIYHVMTAQQIAQGASNGRINRESLGKRNAITPDLAIQTALQAFQDGLFFFFVDSIQHTDLTDEIFITPNSAITLLRLVALAGG